MVVYNSDASTMWIAKSTMEAVSAGAESPSPVAIGKVMRLETPLPLPHFVFNSDTVELKR